MAENVGTITVAIEAQTAELQAGLQRAERAVKQSAQKMEEQSENLSMKVEKSWTEFASKMGVIQQVGAIAQQAWNALDGVLTAVTDSTANASQKLTGSLDAIEAAGIPIVSQFLAIGRGIYGWISGEKALRREIDRVTSAIERRAKAQREAMLKSKSMRDELTEMTSTMLTLLENEVMLSREATEAGKAQIIQDRERQALQEAYDTRLESLKKTATKAFLAEEAFKFMMAMGYLDAKHATELAAAKERDAANEAAHQAEIARVQEETQAKAEAAAREAKMIESTTQGLRDTLAQLTARAAGDEIGAQMIALEAKFRKMREGATADQLKLIAQIESKEQEALAKSGSDDDRRDKTATISTAIGSFTVAMAGDPVEKEQVSLLKRIADSNEAVEQTSVLKKIAQSNEKMADAITSPNSSGGAIIPAT